VAKELMQTDTLKADRSVRAVEFGVSKGAVFLMPKSEIRNPKSETNPKEGKSENSKPPRASKFGILELSNFEFVSDFGFRISD
jgi:hypothetical protein